MKRMLRKFLIRWHLANDSTAPEWLRGEIEKDSELQALWREENALTGALSRERTEDDDIEVSPFLEARILRAVRESEEGPEVASRGVNWRMAYAVGGLAACAVFFAAIFSNNSPLSEPKGGDSLVEKSAAENAAIGLAAVNLKTVDGLAMRDWQNPLDREIESVVVDGRRALSFLAANFVPSEVAVEWGLNDA